MAYGEVSIVGGTSRSRRCGPRRTQSGPGGPSYRGGPYVRKPLEDSRAFVRVSIPRWPGGWQSGRLKAGHSGPGPAGRRPRPRAIATPCVRPRGAWPERRGRGPRPGRRRLSSAGASGQSGPQLGVAAVEELRPGVSLGLQPVEGLAAELRLRGVVGRRVVLSLAGDGQCGGAGGVVARLVSAVVAELRVSLQRLGEQPGGGGEPLRVVAHLCEVQALGGVLGLVVSLQDGRQPPGQGDLLFELANPSGHVPGQWRAGRRQLRGPAVFGERPRRACPVLQGEAEVVVGLGVVGLEPDRLAVCGDGLVELALCARAMPRLLWASASSGLSRIASRYAATASSSLP